MKKLLLINRLLLLLGDAFHNGKTINSLSNSTRSLFTESYLLSGGICVVTIFVVSVICPYLP